MIEVEVQLTFREFLYITYSISFRWLRWILFLAVLYFAVAIFVNVSTPSGASSLDLYLFPTVFFVVTLVLPWLAVVLRWRRNPSITEPTRYTLSEDGLSLSSPSLAIAHKWSNVSGFVSTGTYYFLYIEASAAMVFPARCFTDSQQRDRFHQFVASHISDRRSAQSRGTGRKRVLYLLGIWLLLIIVVFLITWMEHG